MKALIKAGVSGGLVLFFWGMISWMVLPFHSQTLNSFEREDLITEAVFTNISKPGVYVIPRADTSDLTPEERRETQKSNMGQMQRGPFGFFVLNPNGTGKMTWQMIRGLGIQMAGAFLMSWLILRLKIKSRKDQYRLIMTFATAAGIVCHLPEHNWWGFPSDYVLLSITDLLAGWFLAGFVITRSLSR